MKIGFFATLLFSIYKIAAYSLLTGCGIELINHSEKPENTCLGLTYVSGW
jgi:hypothetical protein